MYDIPGWFPEENAQILEYLIRKYNIKTVIEVGSFVGKSTVFFASRCNKVYAIDTFQGTDEGYLQYSDTQGLVKDMFNQFMTNIDRCGVRDKVIPIQADSLSAAKMDINADLVYIDASHVYQNTHNDILAWYPHARKILCGDDYTAGWPDVKKAVDEVKPLLGINTEQRVWYAMKDIIVYTAGVWDLFHTGHLNMLEKSKQLGNKLIVGVVSDTGAAEYKNKPVFNTEDRLRIVSSIKCVDGTMRQETTDPTPNLEIVKPHIFTHADDWPRLLRGHETLEKLEIDYITIPYTKGVSSTLLKVEIKGRI